MADNRVGPQLDQVLARDSVFGLTHSPGNPTGAFIGLSQPSVPTPTPVPQESAPNCIVSRLGQYHRSFIRSGNVLYRRSDDHRPPFEFEKNVTTSGVDTYPCMVIEPATERVYSMWIRNRGNGSPGATQQRAMESFSDDDGETWSEPTVIFQGANTIDAKVGSHDGAIFRCVHASLTGSGFTLQGTYQAPGDATPTTADVFTLVQTSGAIFSMASGNFSIIPPTELEASWGLFGNDVLLAGPSIWYSTDDCRTWQRQFELYYTSVFPNTIFWRAAVGRHDRSVFYCALDLVSPSYVLKGVYLAPGDDSITPSNVFTLLDTAGARFILDPDVANTQNFGVDSSPDIAGAWLLTCVRSGDKNVSDWISTDDCRTWSRL